MLAEVPPLKPSVPRTGRETASGGTVIVSGTLANSGTLFASGPHSLIDISNGATVTGGGVAEIGNGVVDIEGPGQ
jgi:hypothetical protein